jgi:hypothetical protein
MSVNQQSWNNWTPQTPDLGASVTVTYTLGGQQHVTTQNTPFSIQIDVGTQIIVTAGSAQGLMFDSWNWWGDANNYPSSSTWYTMVRGFIPQGTTSYYIAALYTMQVTSAIVTSSAVVSSAMVTPNGQAPNVEGSNSNLAVFIFTGFLAIFVLVPVYAVMSSRRRRRERS